MARDERQMIYRLLYISENRIDPRDGPLGNQLADILRISNRNNEVLGITGALVSDDLWFLQVLEGDREVVWSRFERIRTDPRHAGVRLVEFSEIPRRTFGNWWMGLATRTPTTQPKFEPFTRRNVLQAADMTARQIHGLMIELAKLGLRREVAIGK